MRPPVFTAIATSLLSYAQIYGAASSSYCPNNQPICFQWAVPEAAARSGSGDVYFQIKAPDRYQWVALGTGSRMSGSDMFVIYQNGRGNVTLSTRVGKGHDMPRYVTFSHTELLEGSGMDNGTMVANIRCGDCSSLDLTGSNSWIAAWKKGSSLDSTNPSESIQEHDDYAGFKVDLAQVTVPSNSNPFIGSNSDNNGSSGVSSGSTSSTNDLANAHGIIMSAIFVLAYPIGAILMPYTGKWLVHASWQVIAFLAMWIGFGLGYVVSQSDSSWNEQHVILGVVVCSLLTLQPILGWAHHKHFVKHKQRGTVSPIHIWYGRALMLLGIINGGLGLRLAGARASYIIAYSIFSAFVGALYITFASFFEIKRSQRHRQTESYQMATEEEYSQ